MDYKQLQKLVRLILNQAGLYSVTGLTLLMMTACQESRLKYIRQIGAGPALGLWQMEPATELDIWQNYIKYRPDLAETIQRITGHIAPGPWLEWDIAYQIIMARIHYKRVPEALPGSLDGLARYWKLHYNTVGGAGTAAECLENYRKIRGAA